MAKKIYRGSLFNEKYFEGYKKRIVMDEEGNQFTEFVYEGVYYTPEFSEHKWKNRKTVFTLLSVGCTALFIAIMCLTGAVSSTKWAVAIQALLLFDLLGLDVCVGFRVGAKYKMTVYDYRMAVISVKEFALIGTLVIPVLLIASAVLMITNSTYNSPEVLCLPGYAVCEAAMIYVYHTVRKERFLSEISQDMPHGIDITSEFPDKE